jgi:hypothetical protein
MCPQAFPQAGRGNTVRTCDPLREIFTAPLRRDAEAGIEKKAEK